MSGEHLCAFCHRDPDTGEYFCPRFRGPGGWQEKCPKQDDNRVDDEREDEDEDEEDAE